MHGASGDKPRLFEYQNITAHVTNQLPNDSLENGMCSPENFFCRRRVRVDQKLELPAKNTPHHSVLLFLKGGFIEDVDSNDDIILAEQQRLWQNDELWDVLKKSPSLTLLLREVLKFTMLFVIWHHWIQSKNF